MKRTKWPNLLRLLTISLCAFFSILLGVSILASSIYASATIYTKSWHSCIIYCKRAVICAIRSNWDLVAYTTFWQKLEWDSSIKESWPNFRIGDFPQFWRCFHVFCSLNYYDIFNMAVIYVDVAWFHRKLLQTLHFSEKESKCQLINFEQTEMRKSKLDNSFRNLLTIKNYKRYYVRIT